MYLVLKGNVNHKIQLELSKQTMKTLNTLYHYLLFILGLAVAQLKMQYKPIIISSDVT